MIGIVATCEAEKGWIEAYLGKRCPVVEVTDVKRFFELGRELGIDRKIEAWRRGFQPRQLGDLAANSEATLTRLEAASPNEGADGAQLLTRQDAASPSGESLSCLRTAKTVRYCSAAKWKPWMFRFAAMVPHPSFYVRRECFERLGGYSLDYRICADFELELRYLYLAKLKAAYLPECVVVMRMGGMSTAGWRSNIVINREDLRALRSHGVWSCLPLIYLKYLFKIWGFVFRKR